MSRPPLLLLLLSLPLTGQAASAAELLTRYQQEASQEQSGFAPSAERGQAFYRHRFGVHPQMHSCMACHTEEPTKPGRHVITGKAIAPLAPTAHAERFSDPAKVEKWFRRNCTEVVGRLCSAAEKADFIAFLLSKGG